MCPDAPLDDPEQQGAVNAFVVYHLNGKRFANHEVPIEFLSELKAYQDLFVELCRELYVKNNPDKKRAPNGFYDHFCFNLTQISEGSAGLCLAFDDTELIEEYESIKDTAKKSIENNIESLITKGIINDDFPPHLIGYLPEFGKHLQEGETSSFHSPAASPKVIINRSDNKAMKIAVEITQTARSSPFNTEGVAYAIDTDKTTFGVRLDTSEHLECPLPARYIPLVLKAIKEKDHIRVAIKGTYKISSEGKKKSVDNIENVSVIEEHPDLESRIQELRQLQNDWFDADSKAPNPAGLDWLELYFKNMIQKFNTPFPYLYPTPEGHIQAEWSFGEWLIEGVFNINDHTVDLAAFNSNNDHSDEFEKVIDLNIESGTFELVAMLLSFMKRQD